MALMVSRRAIPSLFAQSAIVKFPVSCTSPALQPSASFSTSTFLRGSGKGEAKEPPKQDFNFYVAKGKELQAKVDAKFASLSSSHAAADISDTTSAYSAKYVIEPTGNANPPAGITGVIDLLKLPAAKNWHYYGTKSKPSNAQGQPAKVAYKNYYVFDPATKTGAIAASWNYNTEDTYPPKERLNLSELFFRQYNEVSKGQPSTLKYVIRDSIEGADSLMIINTVVNGVARMQGTTFAAGSDGFHAFLGSDNGKSVAFMLSDHMNAIRKRIVGVWAKANLIYFVLGDTDSASASSSSSSSSSTSNK